MTTINGYEVAPLDAPTQPGAQVTLPAEIGGYQVAPLDTPPAPTLTGNPLGYFADTLRQGWRSFERGAAQAGTTPVGAGMMVPETATRTAAAGIFSPPAHSALLGAGRPRLFMNQQQPVGLEPGVQLAGQPVPIQAPAPTLSERGAALIMAGQAQAREKYPLAPDLAARQDLGRFVDPRWLAARGPESMMQTGVGLGATLASGPAAPLVGPAVYGLSEMGSNYPDLYQEFLRLGYQPAQAHQFAATSALGSGVVNALVGGVLPFEAMAGRVVKEPAKGLFKKAAVRAGTAGAIEGATEAFEQTTPGIAAQQLDPRAQGASRQEQLEAGVLGAFSGGLFGAGGAFAQHLTPTTAPPQKALPQTAPQVPQTKAAPPALPAQPAAATTQPMAPPAQPATAPAPVIQQPVPAAPLRPQEPVQVPVEQTGSNVAASGPTQGAPTHATPVPGPRHSERSETDGPAWRAIAQLQKSSLQSVAGKRGDARAADYERGIRSLRPYSGPAGPELEYAALVANTFGKNALFVEQTAGAPYFNGAYDPAQPGQLFINARGENQASFVVGHELWEAIQSELGADHERVKAVRAALLTHANDPAQLRLDYARFHDEPQMSLDNALSEFSGDFLGQQIRDPRFWDRLAQGEPSIFRHVARIFVNLVQTLKSRLARAYNAEAWVKESGLEAARQRAAELLIEYRQGQLRGEPAPGPAAPVAPVTGAAAPDFGNASVYRHPNTEEDHPIRYRVREAAELIPSNDAQTFRPRADYTRELQPRDYETDPAEQEKVLRNAARLDPRLVITRDLGPENGPPVVTPEGYVLAGNGRAMTLQRAFNQPAKLQAYQQHLLRSADEYGLDRARIERMRAPVLVRELTGLPRARWREFADQANDTGTKALDLTSQAISTAGRVPLASIAALELDDDTTLREALGDPRVTREFVGSMNRARAFTHQNRSVFVDPQGRLTDVGKSLLEQALLAKAFEGPQQRAALRFLEENRGLRGSITKALPSLLGLKLAVAGGKLPPAYDLAGPLYRLARSMAEKGARTYADLKATQDWVSPATEEETLIGAKLADVLHKPNQLRDALRDFVFKAQAGEDSLLGAAQPLDVLRAWAGHGELKFQKPRGSYPVEPWPEDFPDATIHTLIQTMKAHPDYAAAKQGNMQAAAQVVQRLIKRDRAYQLGRQHPRAMLVPVHAQEATGKNKLPLALAKYTSRFSGLPIVTNIVQTNETRHTDAGPLERLLRQPEFDGPVTPGQEYILVDDVATTGATLQALREYLESHGGKVVDATTLATTFAPWAGSGKHLTPSADLLARVDKKFGLGNLAGVLSVYDLAQSIRHLTHGQLAALYRHFASIDTLRNRITTLRHAAGVRSVRSVVGQPAGKSPGQDSRPPLSANARQAVNGADDLGAIMTDRQAALAPPSASAPAQADFIRPTMDQVGTPSVNAKLGPAERIPGMGDFFSGPEPSAKLPRPAPRAPQASPAAASQPDLFPKFQYGKRDPLPDSLTEREKEQAYAEREKQNRLANELGEQAATHEERRRAVHDLLRLKQEKNEEAIKPGVGGGVPHSGLKFEKTAFLVIGPSAAGKSTLADPLSEHYGALLIDSDIAKRKFANFRGGAGTFAVHEASSQVAAAVAGQAVEQGVNLVWPLVGDNPKSIMTRLTNLKAANYEVHLVLNHLDADKAVRRAFDRFVASGRFVDPVYIFNVVGNKPLNVYHEFVRLGGFDSYAHYSNDVPFGQPPQYLGGTPDNPTKRLLEFLGHRRSGRGGHVRPAQRSQGSSEAQAPTAGEVKTQRGARVMAYADLDPLAQARVEAREQQPGADYQPRGFAERMAADPKFAADQTAIAFSPENYYAPQRYQQLNAVLAQMSDADLEQMIQHKRRQLQDVLSRENAAVKAGIELLSRRHARGQSVADVVETLANIGTPVAQLLRQFAEIKTSTPAGLLAMLEANWRGKGRYMTPPARKVLTDLIDADFKARAALRVAEAEYLKNFDDLHAMQHANALLAAELASRKLLLKIQVLSPTRLGNHLTAFIQGNLLTPLSQVANVLGNAVNGPPRALAQALASMADATLTMATGKPRTVKGPLSGAGAWAAGAKRGAGQAARMLPSGVLPDGASMPDIARGFHPWRALLQTFNLEHNLVDATGRVPLADRLKKAVEATLGVAPEIMFRGLAAGDQVFKTAAHAMALDELGRLSGLSGDALQKFMLSPDAASARLALERATASVYQQDNQAASAVYALKAAVREIPWLGAYLDALFMTPLAPYVKTPLNIVWEGAQYLVPPLPAAQMLYHAARGNRRAALLSMGRLVTGMTMLSAAHLLVSLGLAMGDPDRDEKLRGAQYAGLLPNRLNLSGLIRWLKGGDAAFRDGDTLAKYDKLGFMGLALSIMANRHWHDLKEARLAGKSFAPLSWGAALAGNLPELGGALLQQSFLKGNLTLLEALAENRFDHWQRSYLEAVTALAIPNTVSAVGNTQQTYVPELRSGDKEQTLRNVVKAKLNLTDDLTPKRDLWGRPIRRTPGGANPYLYHLLDILKLQSAPRDFVATIGRQVWENTLDPQALPSVPTRVVTDERGEKHRLADRQYDRYLELVGEERAQLVRAELLRIQRAQPDAQVELLAKAYAQGLVYARRRLLFRLRQGTL
jgi:hypothetical protein